MAIAAIVTSFAATAPAAGSPTGQTQPELSGSVDFSGTGAMVSQVRTATLRDATPRVPRAPRILLVGTGVERPLFPEPVRSAIDAAGLDASDTHGYGTISASTILQLLPRATITSKRVKAWDPSWTMLDLAELAATLEAATAYDAVLLAFPPHAALDPIAETMGRLRYTTTIDGMDAVVHALTDGGATMRGDDATRRFAAAARAWDRVTAAIGALDRAGVPVIAPAGDLTRKRSGTVIPLYQQTVLGLSALPDVITVGASYAAPFERVSPTSGRGPTMAMQLKPDLVAPSDVMTLLPRTSFLQWEDASARAGLRGVEWAAPGVAPTTCPSLQGLYRCALQGSSMVSASVVAANIAALVAAGTIPPGEQRDEIARGIAVATASRTTALGYDGTEHAFPWESGAGVLFGLGAFDPARTVVPLEHARIGETGWTETGSVTVPVWGGAARPERVHASLDSFTGADITGQARSVRWTSVDRVSARAASGGIEITAVPRRAAPGLYAGSVRMRASTGEATAVPLTLAQGMPLDFRASYAYNAALGGGREGERVERTTAVLFAGLPPAVGIVGEAWKTFSSDAARRLGGDPTYSVVLRYATTRDSFTESVAARDHGTGTLRTVPPGFYALHLLSDHAVDARQTRGRDESLGIKLGSSGPSITSDLLVPSKPPCGSDVEAPLGCANHAGRETDPASGLCVERAAADFSFWCGDVAFAVPTAFVTRAVHLIEHGELSSEWKACGVDLPLDGKGVDLGAIVTQAERCPGSTSPSAWRFDRGAPACLGPSERAAYPQGHPSDLTAVLTAPPTVLPTQNLPVAVLSYRFKLPHLNTYTNAALSAAYRVDDAIVAVRFTTATGTLDAANGLLVVDDPDVNVAPAVAPSSATGSLFTEWAVMSANAPEGTLSLVIIPTRWTAPAGQQAARVQLCDVALRVQTYAKAGWGPAGADRTHWLGTLDRGLLAQTDPSSSRTRAWSDGGPFADLGVERQGLDFAIQIPKNTTHSPAPHRVLSPKGDPAHLRAARRLATDGSRREDVLAPGAKAYDPGYGITRLACGEGSLPVTKQHPDRGVGYGVCRVWNRVLTASAETSGLFDEISVNGRFSGTLPVDRAAIARAAGAIAFEIASADDGGAFESRWAREAGTYATRFPVGDFYDERVRPLNINLLSGVIAVLRAADGLTTLTVRGAAPGGLVHSVQTALR